MLPLDGFTQYVTAQQYPSVLRTESLVGDLLPRKDDCIQQNSLFTDPFVLSRHPLHLNERLIFLSFGNSLLFLFLGIRDLGKRRTDATWPQKKVSSL